MTASTATIVRGAFASRAGRAASCTSPGREDRMDIVTALSVGLTVASLTTIVFGSGGFGLLGDLVIGIAGAVLGGWVFHELHWVPTAGLPDDVLTTAIGAVL